MGYYIDLISGRVISLLEKENFFVIEPSVIKVKKVSLTIDHQTLGKAAKVINQSYDQYISISEDITYNTYFCNRITFREMIDENMLLVDKYRQI